MIHAGAILKLLCAQLRSLLYLFQALTLGIAGGCQSSSPDHSSADLTEQGNATVLSTIAPIEILVSAVGGDRVQSQCLITGELDPHSYQLVKGDQEKFRRAKLVFFSGLGLEHGPSLAASLSACPRAISLGRWLQITAPASILQTGDVPDPHLWMDISLWSKGLNLVCDELSRAFPDHMKEFRARTDRLLLEFHAMHERVCARLRSVRPDKRYLMTTHDAFRYFGRAYLAEPKELKDGSWQERIMSPEGLAPESQTSLQQMQRALNYLTEHRIGVVFAESNVNHQSLAKIVQAATASGVPVCLAREKLYGDSMPTYTMGPEGYRAYLKMIFSNADTIARYLTPEAR